MSETKPEETTEEIEVAEDGLPDIESLDDVKELINDGIDKIRDSSMEEIKDLGLKGLNRVFGAWRKLTDTDDD
tara:strand:- start:4628 stop:4846 length:219 start_codon:yes stop_codon:yes gene_type:complete